MERWGAWTAPFGSHHCTLDMPASTGQELQAIDSPLSVELTSTESSVATELQREKRSEHLIYRDLQQALVDLNTENFSYQPSLVSQLKPWSTNVERNVAAQNPQSPPRAQKPGIPSRKIYKVYIVSNSKCWSCNMHMMRHWKVNSTCYNRPLSLDRSG